MQNEKVHLLLKQKVRTKKKIANKYHQHKQNNKEL